MKDVKAIYRKKRKYRNYHKEAIGILGLMKCDPETVAELIAMIAANRPSAIVHGFKAMTEQE
ncbi:MAG: hypothetical protein GY718_14415 [Lentisphaerae bacterium]|nr:hypothetical protein [Lentisphaerota bacterium]